MDRTGKAVDVVVLGAGAAGMMCAFEAGRRGRRVLLLDHGERPGRKILISGGGRCNFTNTGTRAENFVSENLHFARSPLARFTPSDMVALVEKHGIAFHEKTLGQLFCDDAARRIVMMLERECGEAGVELRCGVNVFDVTRAGSPEHGFFLRTSIGDLRAQALVVATGGLSIPKLGATGFGFELARQFGHRVVPTRPALVPLLFSAQDLPVWSDLAGVSMGAVAQTKALPGKPVEGTAPALSARGATAKKPGRKTVAPSFHEKLLVTHRGLSGPVILQISSYWQPGMQLHLDLAPEMQVWQGLKASSARRDRQALLGELKRVLPARFAERWISEQLASGEDWTHAGLDRLETALHGWCVQPAGTEGYAKAEVTAGGVDTRELDARTLQSLKVPELYFIGEVVDVTGWLGGYNFQWAWASAAACGRSL